MPFVTLDGIKTHYVKQGSGPCLLMMASRGFNSTIDSWNMGKWKEMDIFNTLSKHFTLVAYDRREAGLSGGRVEKLTWEAFARQGKLLLEHLGFETAWVTGPCMGASVGAKFGAMYPETTIALILTQPVGGYHWMQKGLDFYNRHIAFVRANGFKACVERAPTGRNFWEDPEAGPWAPQLASDPEFAARYVKLKLEPYVAMLEQSRDALFPDTFCAGATPEELLSIEAPTLVWPGGDSRHTVSAANQMRELIPCVDYWDVPAAKQTAQGQLQAILDFKAKVDSGSLVRKAA